MTAAPMDKQRQIHSGGTRRSTKSYLLGMGIPCGQNCIECSGCSCMSEGINDMCYRCGHMRVKQFSFNVIVDEEQQTATIVLVYMSVS